MPCDCDKQITSTTPPRCHCCVRNGACTCTGARQSILGSPSRQPDPAQKRTDSWYGTTIWQHRSKQTELNQINNCVALSEPLAQKGRWHDRPFHRRNTHSASGATRWPGCNRRARLSANTWPRSLTLRRGNNCCDLSDNTGSTSARNSAPPSTAAFVLC